MTVPMCEYCINFREFDELDIIDDFQRKHFDGFCFSENEEHGKGRAHSKGDWCYSFNKKCSAKDCKKLARWEIGFSKILENSGSAFLCGDKIDNINSFCDNHFTGFNGCGNAITFSLIRDNEWLDFPKHDNLFVLQELVRKSYKLPIQEKFRKITEFL